MANRFVLPAANSGALPSSVAAMAGTLNFAAIEAAAGALLLHAGGVAHPDGGSVVFCGPSGSGKSTLTTVMAGRGYAYVTDETVCLDPLTLRISPYRKPVAVKAGSFEVLQHLGPPPGSVAAACSSEHLWLVSPTELGGAELPEAPLVPRLIILPTFLAGASLALDRLDEGEAAFALGGNSSQGLHRVGQPLQALARLVRRAPTYRMVHGDVHAAADAVEWLWQSA